MNKNLISNTIKSSRTYRTINFAIKHIFDLFIIIGILSALYCYGFNRQFAKIKQEKALVEDTFNQNSNRQLEREHALDDREKAIEVKEKELAEKEKKLMVKEDELIKELLFKIYKKHIK